ncbi:hypothetical protein GCM10010987_35630 [Bradyrhizobium guangdongense]|uniref:LysR substrate-binding domain-containing protein n=1 Tax=Bradyrhizobium guangdongense TaxID=1325090 RepID=A0AA87W6D5_9BRAD|nr:hypothetical protein GCM10010987_35630 [Bradyrhizobium guangdongense]
MEIQVSTSQQSPANFEAQGIDASIEYGLGQWPGLEAKHLFDELLIVVCGPKLANGMPVPRYPHELDHHVLLHSLQRPDFWRQWLQTAGAPQVPANTGLRFENSGLACQAAIDGLGIAIVHLPLIERDLETGRLIAPFNLIVRNQMAFYLAYPTEKSDLPALVAFRAMAAR